MLHLNPPSHLFSPLSWANTRANSDSFSAATLSSLSLSIVSAFLLADLILFSDDLAFNLLLQVTWPWMDFVWISTPSLEHGGWFSSASNWKKVMDKIIPALKKLPLIVSVLFQPVFYQTDCNFHSQFPPVSDLIVFFVFLGLFVTLICCWEHWWRWKENLWKPIKQTHPHFLLFHLISLWIFLAGTDCRQGLTIFWGRIRPCSSFRMPLLVILRLEIWNN